MNSLLSRRHRQLQFSMYAHYNLSSLNQFEPAKQVKTLSLRLWPENISQKRSNAQGCRITEKLSDQQFHAIPEHLQYIE